MTDWLEEIGRLRVEVTAPSPTTGLGAQALHEAVALAHRAASRLLTLDDWSERLDCAGAAMCLNLAEVELREALARSRWVARPVRLDSLPAGEAATVVQAVVALLGDVQAALVAAVSEGGELAGSLPAARTIVDVDDARAALRGEPLI